MRRVGPAGRIELLGHDVAPAAQPDRREEIARAVADRREMQARIARLDRRIPGSSGGEKVNPAPPAARQARGVEAPPLELAGAPPVWRAAESVSGSRGG